MKILKYTGYGPEAKAGAWITEGAYAFQLAKVSAITGDNSSGSFIVVVDGHEIKVLCGRADEARDSREGLLRAVLEAQGVETE